MLSSKLRLINEGRLETHQRIWGEHKEEVLIGIKAVKVNYDKKHDIAYIRFSSKRPDGAIEITEGIVLDTTEKNEIVGIEIFDASRRFPLKNLFSVELLRV